MNKGRFEFDVVVVGAGPAGIAAACAAAESGRSVGVLDDTPWLGGQIWRGEQAGPSRPEARRWFELLRNSRATVLPSTSVFAAPAPGVLLAERQEGPCEIHWSRLILATGARELFLPFPGWTLPGVMGPGGLQALVKAGWPVRDRRVVVAGSGPLLLAAAHGLRKHGAQIISIAEQAAWFRVLGFGLHLGAHPSKFWQGARLLQPCSYRCGTWAVRAEGGEQLRSVALTNGRRTWSEDCDFLACAFGLVPNVELPLTLGCEVCEGFVRVDQWQAASVPGIYCAGEPTGIGGADGALIEGQIAGYAATGNTVRAERFFRARARWHRFRVALAATFALRPELKSIAADDTVVCRCEDVTLGALRQFTDWRDAKLQSRCGMGPCQGRVCGAATRVILGWGMESLRPPILPVRVSSLVPHAEQ